MNASANNPNALAKTLAAGLALSVVVVLMMASRLTSGSAALQERIFEESRRIDRYGNLFRYRAKITDRSGPQLGRWAYDVFLTTTP